MDRFGDDLPGWCVVGKHLQRRFYDLLVKFTIAGAAYDATDRGAFEGHATWRTNGLRHGRRCRQEQLRNPARLVLPTHVSDLPIPGRRTPGPLQDLLLL